MTAAPSNLFPPAFVDVFSARVITQIYEGLVKLSSTEVTITPCLAERWEVNDSSTVFTFFIRKGVKFHDDPCFPEGKGRELTAHDFKYCFDKLCEDNPANQNFWLFQEKVQGAKEYFESTSRKKPLPEGVSGIKATDDHTLVISLQRPFAGFLSILATPNAAVYPREAYEKYGEQMKNRCVGTGPFTLPEIKNPKSLMLLKNHHYWLRDEFGNQLPYVNGVRIDAFDDLKIIYGEFIRKNLDFISEIPVELMDHQVRKMDQIVVNETGIFGIFAFYFNCQRDIFTDKRIRLAFFHAIDRNQIPGKLFKGREAQSGLIPPGFKDFPYEKVKCPEYDPEKARTILAEAGFSDGKGFPVLTLYVSKGMESVAHFAQKMLMENLKIKVEISVKEAGHLIDIVNKGEALFWISGWSADYPEPENFLNTLYSANIPNDPNLKSTVNTSRYRNEIFDEAFRGAMGERDAVKRNLRYAEAHQIVMDEAAILPYGNNTSTNLHRKNLKNVAVNGMNYIDFSFAYFTGTAR